VTLTVPHGFYTHARVDVLVNLNGYTLTARNGIFAFQPAPLQILHQGYAGTMGAQYIQVPARVKRQRCKSRDSQGLGLGLGLG
jgi:hypothetical protein